MLLDLISGSLGGAAVRDISRQLKTDEGTVNNALSSALPLLMGALEKNSSTSSGAESLLSALDRDHDGSVLDDLGALLGQGGSTSGDGILRHLLGNRRPAVEAAVSRSSGMDMQSVGKLLAIVAPLIMGALGKTKRERSLDPGGLSSLLGAEMRSVKKDQSGDLGLLSLLDSDGDGDITDDVAKLGGSLLGKMFGK